MMQMMHRGTDDDVARPGRAPYAAANNTRDSAAGPYREAGGPYKGPDLPYPPIHGRWEASLPEKTWEECTHCSQKSAPDPKFSSPPAILYSIIPAFGKRQSMSSVTL